MPDGIPSITEIVKMLPYRLQLRFDSLSGYVLGMIDHIRSERRIEVRLSREEIQLIQLAAFIYTLDYFFRAGTRAASEASTTFERFRLEGFQVGKTQFTRDNENTRRGENLANSLRESIAGTRLDRIIRTSRSLDSLVQTLVRGFANG